MLVRGFDSTFVCAVVSVRALKHSKYDVFQYNFNLLRKHLQGKRIPIHLVYLYRELR